MRRRLWYDLRIGLVIAGADLRDMIRRNDTRRQRGILLLFGLVVIPVWLSFIQQAYLLGVETRSGVETDVVAIARNLLLPAMLIVVLFGGLGAAQSLTRDSVRPLVLTSAPTRAIVVGKVLYLLTTWLLAVVLVTLPVVGYAVGARAPLFLVALTVGLLPLLLTTMAVGLALAYLLWLGIERLGLPEGVRRLVTAFISVVAFLAAFVVGISFGRTTGDGTITLPTGDPLTPVGWYADILFLGSPVAETPGLRTGVAVGLVLASLVLSFTVLTRIAPAYWYATPTRTNATDESSSRTTRSPSETVGRAGGFTGRFRTVRVALGYTRSAIRRPDQYVFLFYYLFPIAAVLVPVGLNAPEVFPTGVGLSLVLLGVWFAGGIFCLNPLGTEGSMLSQLVLSRAPARTFIHGRLLAGLALGALCVGAGSVIAVVGLLFSIGTPTLSVSLFVTVGVTLVVLAGVLVTSACFALGIGSVLPKFETTEVFDSVETLAPSVFAAIIHGIVSLALLIYGALVVLTLTSTLPPAVPLIPAVFGVGVLALACVALADGSRRYAIARLRDYGRSRSHVDRPFVIYMSFGLGVFALALGQVLALGAVLLLGIDRPIELLLPVLFVLEYLGMVVVAVGFLYATQRGRSYLDTRFPTLRDLLFVVGGVVAMLGLWALGSLIIEGLDLPVVEHTLFDTDDGTPELLLVLIPLVLLVNGPVEELLYRNVIQKYLTERFSTAAAIVLTSVVFTLVHIPAYLTAEVGGLAVVLLLLFGLSCILGGLYAHTRSLFVVSAVHGIYNATLLLLLYITL